MTKQFMTRFLPGRTIRWADWDGGVLCSEDPHHGAGPVHRQSPLAVVPQHIYWRIRISIDLVCLLVLRWCFYYQITLTRANGLIWGRSHRIVLGSGRTVVCGTESLGWAPLLVMQLNAYHLKHVYFECRAQNSAASQRNVEKGLIKFQTTLRSWFGWCRDNQNQIKQRHGVLSNQFLCWIVYSL